MVKRKLIDIEDKSMSKAIISDGQARSLAGSFIIDTAWAEGIEVDIQPFLELPPVERGKRFAAFLRNGCRLTITAPGTVLIDRSKPFNPTAFIGKGWRIEGEDKRSLALTEFNVAKILLQTGLNEGETVVSGDVKRTRLVSQAIQLDAKVAQTLFEEKGQVTLRWMHEHLNVTWIEFLGTILVGPFGYRYTLFLRRYADGSWRWSCHWLDGDRAARNPAVGLAS
jgi:hypothetical protein